MRTTTEVFEDHLAKRLAGKTEEDIKNNYSPKVIIMTGTGAFSGHEGIKHSAQELAEYVKDAVFEYKHTLVEGRFAFLEWTASADNGKVCDGADSFVIEGGIIVFQSVHYTVHKV